MISPISFYFSFNPAVKLFAALQLFVVLLVGRALKRFLVSQPQNAKYAHALIQKSVNPRLEQFIEIDQHVAAQDDIEFIEPTICRQVMLGENDVIFERRAKNRVVVSCRVIL